MKITNALDPSQTGQKGIVLSGIGGSGKTQIVLRYIYQYQHHYSAIIWNNASTKEHARQSFADAADIISSNWPRDLPLAYLGPDDLQRVTSRLRSTFHPNWLLVIDSVDDLEQDEFDKYIPFCHHGSILITSTQFRTPKGVKVQRLEVDGLDNESSRRLLLAKAERCDISKDGGRHPVKCKK